MAEMAIITQSTAKSIPTDNDQPSNQHALIPFTTASWIIVQCIPNYFTDDLFFETSVCLDEIALDDGSYFHVENNVPICFNFSDNRFSACKSRVVFSRIQILFSHLLISCSQRSMKLIITQSTLVSILSLVVLFTLHILTDLDWPSSMVTRYAFENDSSYIFYPSCR